MTSDSKSPKGVSVYDSIHNNDDGIGGIIISRIHLRVTHLIARLSYFRYFCILSACEIGTRAADLVYSPETKYDPTLVKMS